MTKTSKLLKYFSVTALAMSKIQKVSSMTMGFFSKEKSKAWVKYQQSMTVPSTLFKPMKLT
mgnify:CR=1 FL=1